jgi:pyrimidine-nucleoside phosphorylase
VSFAELFAAKRDGGALSERAIAEFMQGYVAGTIADHQAAALLTAIFVHGMEPEELACWTRAMLESGTTLDLARLDGPKVDKHSTGGIGDKASLPLAPAVAACGAFVPMISGRGLGHTGGTLDKLESIPGLDTGLDEQHFVDVLARCGLAFGAQTATLVPADRKLYALRDVTGLVASIPLIASSILSKKLAEGLDALVLDVKFGSGAFLPEVERGAELARAMLAIAEAHGLAATAFQTAMDRPLGRAVGHALEVKESLACLRGGGPDDLRELVLTLGAEMLRLGGLARDEAAGRARVAAALDDGTALERFARVVAAQGGDAGALEDEARLPAAPDVEVLAAPASGTLAFGDLRELGLAVTALGGGRRALGERIDPAVGLVLLGAAGDEVRAGEPLIELHHRAGHGLAEARERVLRAVRVGAPEPREPLVIGVRSQSNSPTPRRTL